MRLGTEKNKKIECIAFDWGWISFLPSKIKEIFDRAPKDAPMGFVRKLKLADKET